jgi:nitrite reductase/ring-hydroxylating ferredoxin subunit
VKRKIHALALDELPDGTMKAVRAGGRELLLVRRGREIYALRNVCPHQGARLSDGVLSCTRRGGRVGEYVADLTGRIVRCPWHNWEYDAADGASLHDPQHTRVASYETVVEEGKVWVIV